MRKSFYHLIMMFIISLFFVSCTDDEEKVKNLGIPIIIQQESFDDNKGITLIFAWENLEGCTHYDYRLELEKEEENVLITQGSTTDLNVIFETSDKMEILYDAVYVFTIWGTTENEGYISDNEAACVSVKTPPTPFRIDITELAYDHVAYEIIPRDPTMTYLVGNPAWSKYTKYESDMDFIEGYEYGFFMMMGGAEAFTNQGSKSFKTTDVEEGEDIVIYAYGVNTADKNEIRPFSTTTPLIKQRITIPMWTPKSDCTFEIEVLKNDSYTFNEWPEYPEFAETHVELEIQVIPSNENERYMVAFLNPDDMYDKPIQDAMAITSDMGRFGEVTPENWAESSKLNQGKTIVNSRDNANCILTNALHFDTNVGILVWGVDENCQVSTAVSYLEVKTVKDPMKI